MLACAGNSVQVIPRSKRIFMMALQSLRWRIQRSMDGLPDPHGSSQLFGIRRPDPMNPAQSGFTRPGTGLTAPRLHH